MSQQSPVVRARVSKLRSGFLAGGGMASGEAPSYAAAAPEAGAGGGEQGGLPARPKVVISSLNQVPPPRAHVRPRMRAGWSPYPRRAAA
jgi:hypothetical protein